MSTKSSSRRNRLAQFVSVLFPDLVLALVFTWLVVAGLEFATLGTLARFLLGGLLLFFLTGYALLAALYPGAADRKRIRSQSWERRAPVPHSLTIRERFLLSFGVSVALIPLFALVLDALGQPFSESTIAALLATFVVACALVAGVRRLRLPVERRFSIPFGEWMTRTRTFLFGGGPLTVVVNVFLLVSVVAGVGAGVYALGVPQPDAEYTEFALLTESDDGEYVSNDYPTNLTTGETTTLVTSVENQHRDSAEYTVVVELQQVETTEEDRIRVLSGSELARFSESVESNDTWYQPHEIRPEQAGENLRLTYYLYRGSAPDDPDAESADRTLHLWVDVSVQG